MDANCSRWLPLIGVTVMAVGCTDVHTPLPVQSDPALHVEGPTAPAPVIPVNLFGDDHELWPYTGVDFSGVPQDPLNLIFVGNTDPRMLRAALMFLDGDRTTLGLPADFPFNCTWKDAIGGNQAAYGLPAGWVGNGVQLECGDYGPIRFHVRFFDVGGWTLGGAHFEFQIPDTPEHDVISWELGEQLVWIDFLRSGLVYPGDPVGLPVTVPLNEAPFDFLDPFVFNLLPDELKVLMTGSTDPATSPVPIPTDGAATVILVPGTADIPAGIARQRFTIDFDQTIPKPFCGDPSNGYLYVNGPISLRQQVVATLSGNLVSQFHANGHLLLTPVNPLTGEVVGATYRALVNEHHKNIVTDQVTLVSQLMLQVEIPGKGPQRGRLSIRFNVGPGHADHAVVAERCDP